MQIRLGKSITDCNDDTNERLGHSVGINAYPAHNVDNNIEGMT